MKTTVSIPDELYAEVEQLSRRLKRPRSRLYADAVREYLVRHDPEAITEALNRVYDFSETPTDPAITAAARHLLAQVEW